MEAKFWVEVIAALTIPISFVSIIIYRMKRDSGAGYRVIQLLALGSVLPAVLILALERLIETGTIAALLGTMIGYVFSPAAKPSKNT